MKRSLTEIIFADCLFIIFISLSSFFGAVLGDILYALAFVIPVFALLILWKRREREDYKISVLAPLSSMKTTALLLFPIIFIILLISFATGFIMDALELGGTSPALDGNLVYIIALKAVAPAIFEEMLFRYLPIRALGAHSPRLTVIYSAVLFALAHCNLVQIPYALFAGLAFAAIDIAATSVLPSIVIHFANNVLSILWQRNSVSTPFSVIFLSAMLLLTAVSVVLIYLKRKKLKEEFSCILSDKSKLIFTYSFGLYIIATLFAAVSVFVI